MEQQTIIANQEYIEDVSGLKIFFRSWRPVSNVHGTVIIVPGFKTRAPDGHIN